MGFFDKKEEAPKGKKGAKKVVKKAVKKTVKKVVKKVAKKAAAKPMAKGARPMQGGAKTGAGPLGTAKSFFSFGNDGNADSAASQGNWLFQAFNGLKSLPGSESGKYSSKSKDNTMRKAEVGALWTGQRGLSRAAPSH